MRTRYVWLPRTEIRGEINLLHRPTLSLSLSLLLFSPTIRIREGERSRPSFSRFLQGFAMFEEAMGSRTPGKAIDETPAASRPT